MKPISNLLFFSLLFFASFSISECKAQSIIKLPGDTIKLYSYTGNGAELVLENKTKSKAGAFLRNKSNGRTEFAYAVDSIWKNGDTLKFRRGDGTATIAIPNAGGITLTNNKFGDSITISGGGSSTTFSIGSKLNKVDTAAMLTPYKQSFTGVTFDSASHTLKLIRINGSESNVSINTGWTLNGNDNIVTGTHFIGTINDASLEFRQHNIRAGFIGGAYGVSGGLNNTSFGLSALRSFTFGDQNTAFGYRSGESITTGNGNVTAGWRAMSNNPTGSRNISIGTTSLHFATAGNQNTAIGHAAGYQLTTGSNNIIIGGYTDVPNPTGNNQLNIGGAIYGTGLGTTNPSIGLTGYSAGLAAFNSSGLFYSIPFSNYITTSDLGNYTPMQRFIDSVAALRAAIGTGGGGGGGGTEVDPSSVHLTGAQSISGTKSFNNLVEVLGSLQVTTNAADYTTRFGHYGRNTYIALEGGNNFSALQSYNPTTSAFNQLAINSAGGNVTIGTSTDTGEKLQVAGATKLSGTLNGTTANFSNALSVGTDGFNVDAAGNMFVPGTITVDQHIISNSNVQGNYVITDNDYRFGGSTGRMYLGSNAWGLSFSPNNTTISGSGSASVQVGTGAVLMNGGILANGDIRAYGSGGRQLGTNYGSGRFNRVNVDTVDAQVYLNLPTGGSSGSVDTTTVQNIIDAYYNAHPQDFDGDQVDTISIGSRHAVIHIKDTLFNVVHTLAPAGRSLARVRIGDYYLQHIPFTVNGTRYDIPTRYVTDPLVPSFDGNSNASSLTPDVLGHNTSQITISSLENDLTVNAPSATGVDFSELLIRITSNSSSHALTWNAIYHALSDFALPTTIAANQTMYVQFIYNYSAFRYDAVGLTQ